MGAALPSYGHYRHHSATPANDTQGEAPCFSRRCAGLAMRAAILALGLSLGGAGPVLGADANQGLLVKTSLGSGGATAAPRWNYRDAWGAKSERLQPRKPDKDDESELKEAISDPLFWGEWRLVTKGREQVIGMGLLHPGAKPEIMKKRARLLELRVYMPY